MKSFFLIFIALLLLDICLSMKDLVSLSAEAAVVKDNYVLKVAQENLEYSQKIDEILSIMDNKNKILAIHTLDAARQYNVHYKTLACLINSESGYKRVAHKLDYVKGLSGINTKVWDLNVSDDKHQIYAGAYVLRKYMNKYANNELKALTGYKGVSTKGRNQAKLVLSCKENSW